ncbi:MAG: hypothetical protein RMY36_025250 [Nostoc sp. SerVER01]|uniref:hypothetical protein n=1 Tax=Nostoc sp. CCY 9925 TaxID=3103865 RepID=UPI002AD8763F|nr:hypothetical protein [Nostoc sp. SerVER01]MDZ8241647.1 hypothetical protein [Nostoc sp. ChiQUE01a]
MLKHNYLTDIYANFRIPRNFYKDENKQTQACQSDRLQILAYALLLESALGITVK